MEVKLIGKKLKFFATKYRLSIPIQKCTQIERKNLKKRLTKAVNARIH